MNDGVRKELDTSSLVDIALDSVLKAGGIKVGDFKDDTLLKMKQTMARIMYDQYIAGRYDEVKDLKTVIDEELSNRL